MSSRWIRIGRTGLALILTVGNNNNTLLPIRPLGESDSGLGGDRTATGNFLVRSTARGPAGMGWDDSDTGHLKTRSYYRYNVDACSMTCYTAAKVGSQVQLMGAPRISEPSHGREQDIKRVYIYIYFL